MLITESPLWRVLRLQRLLAAICIAVAVAIFAANANAHDPQARYNFSIQKGTLGTAMDAFVQQTQVQLLYPHELAQQTGINPVNGSHTINEALRILLRNTDFSGDLTEGGVIVISHRDHTKLKDREKTMERGIKNRKTLLATFVTLFAAGAGAQGVGGDQEAATQQNQIDEIIVTASKRKTSLQDTSVAISVLSEDTIEKRGLVDMNDYLATIPGASFIEYDVTNKKIILRGLSVGPQDPQGTASAYLGEMPVSSALAAFDVALVDVERIEVLKGPQGTLFGSNSLGGLVRTIPMSPNLNEMGGNLKVDFSTQDESDDTNHSLTGAINIPLIEDQLALRIAAYQFNEAGYIDIVSSPAQDAIAAATGATAIVKDDSNSSTNEGVRASLLWQPTEDLKVSLIYGTQKNDVDNTSDVSTYLPGYQISYLNTPATATSDLEYSNLVIEYDFGWASLLSSSSLLNNESEYLVNVFSINRSSVFGPAQSGVFQDTNLKTQEIRLVSHLNGPWEYLAGVFYEKAELDGSNLLDWIGDITANPFGAERLQDLQTDLNYEQKALFGDISYQFNEQWLLTLGGRHFQYDRIDTNTSIGNAPFNGADSEEDIGESGNIYKANLAFTPNENTLIYGQWSEGFRLGRGQAVPNSALCDVDDNPGILDGTDGVLTPRVESDTTANLELGLKLSLLDNRLAVNTAIFKTDWDNLPTRISSTSDTCPAGTAIVNNIGSAQSQGIEVDATYLLDAWQLNLSASYMDTKRTNTRPPIEEGERLVYAPRTNATAGVQYNFMLNDYSGFVRTDISYVGEYASAERAFAFRAAPAGDYVDASLHIGITMNQWDLTFYGTNLTGNEDVRISNGAVGDITKGIRAVPRKLGVKVSYDF
ncbi:TonB-dependent receptor [Porticoccaceae bacterium]|nr:TonB-dependent receptor [Porticoccaceae bacterium]